MKAEKVCKICEGMMNPFVHGLYDDRYGYPGTFDFVRCSKCGFVQIGADFSEATLAKLYTDYYPRKNLDASTVVRSAKFKGTFSDRLVAYWKGTDLNCHFHAKSGESVLEIGSGTGTSLLELRNMGARAIGTEYDQNVKPIADELGLKIHFGRVETLPDSEGSFDLIALNQVIEHVTDPEIFLRVLGERLGHGGRIVLSFPNFGGLNRVLFGKKWINWHVPYHLSFFTRKTFTTIAERVGYRVEKFRTVTPTEWFKLQVLEAFFHAKQGKRSLIWNPYDASPTSFRLFRKMVTLCAYALTPFLRLIDLAGFGDGILVVLTAKPRE